MRKSKQTDECKQTADFAKLNIFLYPTTLYYTILGKLSIFCCFLDLSDEDELPLFDRLADGKNEFKLKKMDLVTQKICSYLRLIGRTSTVLEVDAGAMPLHVAHVGGVLVLLLQRISRFIFEMLCTSVGTVLCQAQLCIPSFAFLWILHG